MKLASPALRALATAWYGVIPDDWGVERFKHLATIRNGQVDPEDPRFRDLPLFAPNHIESGTGRLLGVESADEQGAESGKYLVRKGEIVYSKIRPALRKAALAPCDGLCSADMYPVAPRSHAYAEFLLFEMLSEGFSRYSVLESERVAMPKINRDALGECPLVYPDLPRQKAIATFLDRKTAAIDALIAKKERQIGLLGEKRQALVTQAVTKGLDPNVPMKDSGVEWLGKVPQSWEVLRGKFLLKCYGGYAPEAVEETDDVGAIDYYKVDDLNQDTGSAMLDRAERKIRAVGLAAIYPPAILIPKRGAAIFTNKVRLIPAACSIDSNVMGLRVLGGHNAEFLALSLFSRGLHDVADVSTIPQINNKHIKELVFAVPSPREQTKIVAQVRVRLDQLGRLMVAVTEHILRLREYRQALISAAVTGRIDIPAEEAA